MGWEKGGRPLIKATFRCMRKRRLLWVYIVLPVVPLPGWGCFVEVSIPPELSQGLCVGQTICPSSIAQLQGSTPAAPFEFCCCLFVSDKLLILE